MLAIEVAARLAQDLDGDIDAGGGCRGLINPSRQGAATDLPRRMLVVGQEQASARKRLFGLRVALEPRLIKSFLEAVKPRWWPGRSIKL